MALHRGGGGPRSSTQRGGRIPSLVEVMSSPRFYPHHPGSVHHIRTHISDVFLAGPLVYKVKRPVDFGFLDYSTLRKRAYWCRREVELNRRLAPDLYLDRQRIYRRGTSWSLEPGGRVAEYAVVMKRLPEERLLSSLMARGRATVSHSRRIARRIAAFHASAPPASTRNSSLSILRRNIEENFRQTEPFIGRTVNAGDYRLVDRYSRGFLEERAPLLRRRVGEGRFRDGHGDLHAEHICLTDGIVIYDCLEFSPRLRQCDVAADIAFLYMDLLYHRHRHLARSFAEEYIRVTGDWEIRLLLPFYACYRAVVREKVESFRFADPKVPRRQKESARRRAIRYFHLAGALARRDGRPRLFAVGGLPGTGKSTLALFWAERLGALCIRSDAVRKELAGINPLAPRRDRYGEGIYSKEWTEKTYGEVMRRAGEALAAGHSVVIDATFPDRSRRRMAASAARRGGASFLTVECRCPEGIVLERIRKRGAVPSLSDADVSVYRAMKKSYIPPPSTTVKVRTDHDLEKACAQIAAAAFPL
jgi:hypothetical protein